MPFKEKKTEKEANLRDVCFTFCYIENSISNEQGVKKERSLD